MSNEKSKSPQPEEPEKSQAEILKEIHALFAHIPKHISLVDELIAERRTEAKREEEEMSDLNEDQ